MNGLDLLARAIALSLVRQAQREGADAAYEHYEMLCHSMNEGERESFDRMVVDAKLLANDLGMLAGEAVEERNEVEK